MRTIRDVTVLSFAAVCLLAAWSGTAAAKTRVWQPRLVPGAGSFAPPAGTTPSTSRAFVPGQLLVEFRAGVSGAQVRTAARGAGSVISRRLPASAPSPAARSSS